MATKIICRASDCIFWDNRLCTSEEIVYDPEEGCLTYEVLDDLIELDEDEELLDEDEELLDDDEDVDDLWDDDEDELFLEDDDIDDLDDDDDDKWDL